jgi:hypothetical protein
MAKKSNDREVELIVQMYQNLLVMAPKTLQDCREAICFHEHNGRPWNEYGDGSIVFDPNDIYFPIDPQLEREIVKPFVRAGGWDPQETAIGVRMNDEEKEDARNRLQRQWEKFKSNAATGDKRHETILACFEDRHVVRGKIKTPSVRLVMCNRRFSQLMNVCSQLVINANGDMSKMNTFIPVMLLDTPDGRFFEEDHEKIFMLRENDKTEGFKPLSTYAKVKQAYSFLIDLGKRRSWLDKNTSFTSGNDREKVAGFTYLSHYDQEKDFGLQVLERLSPNVRWLKDENGKIVTDANDEKVENPDWINEKRFSSTAWLGRVKEGPYEDYPMINLVNLSEDLDELNAKRARVTKKNPVPKEPIDHRPDRDEVIEWLNHWQNKGTTIQQMMNRDQIKNLMRLHSSRPARDMAKAVFERDENLLKKNSERSAGLNWVYECDESVYHSITALAAVVKERKIPDNIVVEHLDKLVASLEEMKLPENKEVANATK